MYSAECLNVLEQIHRAKLSAAEHHELEIQLELIDDRIGRGEATPDDFANLAEIENDLKKKVYKSVLAVCGKCGAELRAHWLIAGVCNGCRNPESVVTAVVDDDQMGWVL